MRTGWGAVVAVALVAGCLEADTVQCADGRICPQGLICIDAFDRCGRPEQLTACATLETGDSCPIAGVEEAGVCVDGVCLRAGCGDTFVTGSEECDIAGVTETSCTALGYYDDGVVTCQSDCSWDDSACTGFCGDQMANGAEVCDGDDLGTALSCTDLGFYRELSPPTCTEICTVDSSGCADYCGDGVVNGPEFCDGQRPALDCVDLGGDAGHPTCTALGCSPNLASCVRFGWRRVTTVFSILGRTEGLYDLHGSAPDNVWAVGTNGLVLRYDGRSWSELDSGLSSSLISVWTFAPDDAWLITASGELIHYDGTDFAPQTAPGGGGILTDLWASGPGDLYLTGGNGLLAHYDGTGWTTIDTGTGEILNAVSGSGPGYVLAVGGAGTVVELAGGSRSTTTISVLDLLDVGVSAPGEAIALFGGSGSMVLSGGNWQPVSLSAAGVVWVGDGGAVSGGPFGGSSYFDGALWQPINFGTGVSLSGIWGDDISELLAISSGGSIYAFDGSFVFDYNLDADFADVWGTSSGDSFAISGDTLVYSPPNDSGMAQTLSPGIGTLSAVWASAVDDLWVAGTSGMVSHWNGSVWVRDTVAGGALYGINGRAADDIVVVGAGGAIYQYDGADWNPLTSPVSDALRDVWLAPGGDLVAVGDNGTIVQGSPGSLVEVASPTTINFDSVWGAAPDDIWAVGHEVLLIIGGGTAVDTVVAHYDGTSWREVAVPMDTGLRRVRGRSADDVFAVGRDGRVLHWDGVDWARVRVDGMEMVSGVYAAGEHVWITGTGRFERLVRAAAWPCLDCASQ